MPITYTIDSGKKFITEVWTGEIDAACLADYWCRLLVDPEAMTIRRTLVDLRGANILLKGADIQNLIQTIAIPMLNGKKWKTAIVVDKPAQYGVSRQYQTFADHYSKDAIFHDMRKAQDWLMGLPD